VLVRSLGLCKYHTHGTNYELIRTLFIVFSWKYHELFLVLNNSHI